MINSLKSISAFLGLASIAFLTAMPQDAAAQYIIGGLDYSPSGTTETINAPFTASGGTFTANQYSGDVLLTVSGSGEAFGTQLNDAFYRNIGGTPVFAGTSGIQDAGYYTLITALGSGHFNTTDSAFKYLAYNVLTGDTVTSGSATASDIPYEANDTYEVILNLGLESPSAPARLDIGVADGSYGDNTGSFSVQITQLTGVPVTTPDGGSTALFLGLAVGGLACINRRRTVSV